LDRSDLLGIAPSTISEFIHVLADTAHRISLDGVVSHRSGLLEAGDVIVRDGCDARHRYEP
jgi:hypothetical protein